MLSSVETGYYSLRKSVYPPLLSLSFSKIQIFMRIVVIDWVW